MSASPALWKEFGAVTDRELVATAATGAEGSFEELVRRYQRPISSYVYRMVGDYEAALDLPRRFLSKSMGHSLATAPSLSSQRGFIRSRTTARWIIYAAMPDASAHCSAGWKATNTSCQLRAVTSVRNKRVNAANAD